MSSFKVVGREINDVHYRGARPAHRVYCSIIIILYIGSEMRRNTEKVRISENEEGFYPANLYLYMRGGKKIKSVWTVSSRTRLIERGWWVSWRRK